MTHSPFGPGPICPIATDSPKSASVAQLLAIRSWCRLGRLLKPPVEKSEALRKSRKYSSGSIILFVFSLVATHTGCHPGNAARAPRGEYQGTKQRHSQQYGNDRDLEKDDDYCAGKYGN